MLHELQILFFHIFAYMDIGRKFIFSYSGHCVDSINKMVVNIYIDYQNMEFAKVHMQISPSGYQILLKDGIPVGLIILNVYVAHAPY